MQRRIEEDGGGRLGPQQVIHMLASKPKGLLFRPILRRRWEWTLSLLLWETEASSAREEEDVRVMDSPSKRSKAVRNLHIRCRPSDSSYTWGH